MKLLAVAFMKSRTYIFQQIYIVPFFYSSLAVEMSCKYKILKVFFGSCFLKNQYASEFYFDYLISVFIHSVQIISQSFNSSQRKRKKSYKIFLIIHFINPFVKNFLRQIQHRLLFFYKFKNSPNFASIL